MDLLFEIGRGNGNEEKAARLKGAARFPNFRGRDCESAERGAIRSLYKSKGLKRAGIVVQLKLA